MKTKTLTINNVKYCTYLIEQDLLFINIAVKEPFSEGFLIEIIQHLEKVKIAGTAHLNV